MEQSREATKIHPTADYQEQNDAGNDPARSTPADSRHPDARPTHIVLQNRELSKGAWLVINVYN